MNEKKKKKINAIVYGAVSFPRSIFYQSERITDLTELPTQPETIIVSIKRGDE